MVKDLPVICKDTSGPAQLTPIYNALEKNALCALEWSDFSSLVGRYCLGRGEDFYDDWRKVTPALRWGTMNGDAESLKEAYPLVLVYTDAEAGLAEVNDPQTPPLRRQNIRKRSL
ncbi:MAG: hypothetical protein DRH97_03980 [Chloroflexi bacterium]|nr:MAG: hypothetical protein DRH97_03980 [Chloroflexota bacterium]